MNKKVLIVTYYWPPSGGSGVQRWLKFVKYLCREGWEPIIFTPENPSFTMRDESLLKDVPPEAEVIRLPIWEPYRFFFRLLNWSGKKTVSQTDFVATGRKNFFQAISAWIRGNFFIPDARIFWVKPAVAVLSDLIKSNHIDKIITTGPPHSIHLIGMRLKVKNPNLKWIADFRDPWSEWDLLDNLSMTGFARNKHRKLERKVLKSADRVITIAPFHVKRFEELGGRKVDLITNGFDADDFNSIVHKKTGKFTIRHLGVVDELRDPKPFMNALTLLLNETPELKQQIKVEFIGNVNSNFKKFVLNNAMLASCTNFVEYVPHTELVNLFGETDLQLLVLAHTAQAEGNLPGKLFEYLASGKPILALGPVDGDAAVIIGEAEAGRIVERSDAEGIKGAIQNYYRMWKGEMSIQTNKAQKYSRSNLTKQLIQLLTSLAD